MPADPVTGDVNSVEYCTVKVDIGECKTGRCEGYVGNPIQVAKLVKVQRELDYSGPLPYSRTYRSDQPLFRGEYSASLVNALMPRQPLPKCYMSTATVSTSEGTSVTIPHCFNYMRHDSEAGFLEWTDVDGRIQRFGTTLSPALKQTSERLTQLTLGEGQIAFIVAQPTRQQISLLSEKGRLLRTVSASGLARYFEYSDATTPASQAPHAGLLLKVRDSFGRVLELSYTEKGNVSGVNLPSGDQITYTHEPVGSLLCRGIQCERLVAVTYPDGSSKTYQYGESDRILSSTNWAFEQHLLTGITDELGIRYASFSYRNGLAVATEHAGGTDRYTVERVSGGGSGNGSVDVSAVTDPYLSVRQYRFMMTEGVYNLIQYQGAGACPNCSFRSQTVDSAGNIASTNDNNTNRTCRGYDLARSLETVTVNGLAAAASCSVTGVGAALPAGARKTSTQWHPDWELPIRVTEPGKLTTSVYNGQPDPFNSNAAASCAPSTALLPDGKPIAVLCKRVEQATADVNGAAGFSAPLQPGVAPREWNWTYNEFGQVLTEDGPRTDVSDVTTYEYYPDTTADHTKGDLKQVTNPAGQVTQFTKYNPHGQVLESLDMNNVLTVNTYDLRQRLLSSTVGDQATTYTYDPVGQLKKVTLPDASWIGYDYDDAHRMVAVYDHKGNRTDYVLDNAGNRTAENTKDPSGSLKRQMSRTMDALGRVQQTTGRE